MEGGSATEEDVYTQISFNIEQDYLVHQLRLTKNANDLSWVSLMEPKPLSLSPSLPPQL